MAENAKKKNICFVVPQLRVGGNGKTVSMLSKIAENDYNVTVVVFDDKDRSYDYGGTLISLDLPPAPSKIGKAIVSIKRINKLKKIIRDQKIDILFCVTAHQNLISTTRFRGVKKIVSCRDSAALANNTDKYMQMLEKSDLMVFNSDYMREYLLKRMPGAEDKCRVLQNSVDIERILKLSNQEPDKGFLDFINGKRCIISCGRMCREKGFDHLLRAFSAVHKKYDDAVLAIVGDGEYYDKLKSLASQLGLDNYVYFAGYQSNPYAYLSRASIYALSSNTEGFPNVMLEAMTCSLPVVAANIKSGPNEILKKTPDYSEDVSTVIEADYGVLTPELHPDDSYAPKESDDSELKLADGICLLLADENKRLHYIEKSAERCKYFSIENTAPRFEKAIL
ncbi:MAG: glycosyltransferase [Firmicutes bacterium]|nr:glycosyltransferase [Bacillota bacterium]